MSRVAPTPFWSLHSHSKFSVNDALPEVPAMVERAVELDYPALGLTDHRTVSGSVQLYKACRKAGIEPLPGIELDVVPDADYAGRKDAVHLTMAAYTEAGYRNLMRVATTTARRYWYKPLIDFSDFAEMAESGATQGLVVATGCFFGLVPQLIMHRGVDSAVQVVNTLAGWFPRLYVEMQNHGVTNHHAEVDITDDELCDLVWEVAQRSGIPTILGRDSHYIHEEDRPVHDGLKRLVSFSEDSDDAVFPGSGYFMTDLAGMRPYFEPHHLAAGMEGLADLAQAACVRIPDLEVFNLKVPDVSLTEDPQTELEEKVLAAMTAEQASSQVWLDQVRAEFEVIAGGGMAPYLLLVDMVCEFMRENGISYHARGSAAGSAVNYILGITQADPIRFGLRFDRFLSTNRLKPPDVDLDVEHERRDEVVQFLQRRWSVRSVGSHMKYSLFDEEEDEGKGSLRVRYYSTLKKRGRPAPIWRDIPTRDKELLTKLAGMKLISGYGTHAAGYIVAPDEQTVADLPLAYIASSKKMVTAYGKKDVEQLGFLKLDLLGLRTRTAIRIAEEIAGISFDEIPDDDPATMKAISNGRTAGVFQLEGHAMTIGCEQLRPKKIEDIVAAQALFRPATMKSGATGDYRARRARREAVPQRHPDITNATRETFGVLLYQEQVMDVLQSLGLDQSQLEEMLDAVKASNEYSEGAATAIEKMMPRIRSLATDRGWSEVDIEWLAEGLGAYADYSFNKAHAASYGVIAYRTAYMRTHHPVAHWTGMLVAYADHAKAPLYTRTARADRVKILRAHVNHSGATYSHDAEHNAIRRGLMAIKGVGRVAAEEIVAKAPYSSLTDFGQRVLPRKVSGAKALAMNKSPLEAGGVVAALDDAGALDGLEEPSGP